MNLPSETGEGEISESLKALFLADGVFIFNSILSIFSAIGRHENVKGTDVFQFNTVTNSCVHLVSNYGKRRKWKINGFDTLRGVFFQSPVTSV